MKGLRMLDARYLLPVIYKLLQSVKNFVQRARRISALLNIIELLYQTHSSLYAQQEQSFILPELFKQDFFIKVLAAKSENPAQEAEDSAFRYQKRNVAYIVREEMVICFVECSTKKVEHPTASPLTLQAVWNQQRATKSS